MTTPTPESAATASFDCGGIPSDVLYDVLLRLPAKHLGRLRAVCRPWRSILSDPLFVAAHASRHPGPLIAVGVVDDGGRCDDEDGMISTVGVRIMDMSGDVVRRVPGVPCSRRVMRSHDGLACVAGESRRIRAVDLCTGAVSVISDNLHGEQACSHRYDQDECSCAQCAAAALLLGRTASGARKALRIRHYFCRQLCEVLTLADGRWSKAPGPPTTVRTGRRHMAVVNGVAYFLVDEAALPVIPLGPHLADVDAADSVASFDLATERWTAALLRGPLSSCSVAATKRPPPRRRHGELTLAALNGRLVAVHHNDDDLTLDLWFRLDDDPADADGEARWCRRYAIRYHAVFQMFYENEVEPLCLLDDDRGRVALWVWRHGRRDGVLRVYDPTCDAAVDVVEVANCVDVGALGEFIKRH